MIITNSTIKVNGVAEVTATQQHANDSECPLAICHRDDIAVAWRRPRT